MKRYLFLLWLPFLWISCEEDSIEDVFDVTPEHRVAVALDSMEKIFLSAKYGWIASFKYNEMQDEAYFYLHFKENGRVVTTTGYGEDTINYESTYVLKYGQQMDLVFDSYSPFSDILHLGADFRFELKDQEGAITRWGTRGDGNPDLGLLTLMPAPDNGYYDELIKVREKMISNVNKSYYRILTLDGSDEIYSVTIQANILFEWLNGEEIESQEILMDLNTEGFSLDQPFVAGGKRVSSFVYVESGDYFEVYDEAGQKIGKLAYTNEKPFVRPGMVQTFLDKVGASSSNLRIYVFGWSGKFTPAFAALKEKWPGFSWMIIQPYNDLVVFNFKEGQAYFEIITTYGEDEITFTWNMHMSGTPISRETEAWTKPIVKLLSATFSIVQRGGNFYFIKNDDPSTTFIGTPNALATDY